MDRYPATMAFLHSREGRGWIAILAFAAVLSAVIGFGFYHISVRSFVENKSDEKTTALQLVEAFVSNYSDVRADLHAGDAPVPATFRAHSIALFNQMNGNGKRALQLRWIGRAGRAIATAPTDPQMAAAIEAFVGKPTPAPESQILAVNGKQIFRTVYPTLAQQSCVDCHNRLQPNEHWKLDDVMGAFALDVPIGPFLRGLRIECAAIALAAFLLIGATGLWISLSHYHRIVEREAARQRAETASRAKSSFLATMSHELRTPLNAIIGFSEMMLHEVVGEFRHEHYRPYTEDIHASGTHLLHVINDILDLSKAEAGKLDLKEEVFDLHEMFRSMRNLLGERIRGNGLTAKLDLPADLPRLRADELKTKQVLLNLLTNATKFTPSGGTIEVLTNVDKHGLALTVADTGIGIAEGDVERVLHAFEQADSSMAREHDGTGLGLPLAKAYMELQGGTLSLSSTLGAGTRVTITFPPDRLVYETAAALRPAA